MEITGSIIEVLEEQSGQSAKGGWRKQQYVLETKEQYPKKICFMVWGDKIDDFSINKGQDLEVSIDIESREFNGRWYTDVKAWKVTQAGGAPAQSAGVTAQSTGVPKDSSPMPDEEPLGTSEETLDDLPF